MNGKNRKVSIGTKLYVFVILIVLAVAFGTAAISYTINARQIDIYFKRLAYNSAENFAALVDVDYLSELKETVISDEYQELRDKAEEAEDEGLVEKYLTEKGLWEKYQEQRGLLCTYLETMDDIKYLYIIVLSDRDSLYDMYLLDDDETELYETGYYEEREPELYGIDTSKEIEPTISNGSWGWLCSAYAPVYADDGSIICHIGCDVDMDEIIRQRFSFLAGVIISAVILTAIVLAGAILFANRVIAKPLDMLTAGTQKFRPAENVSYEDAGVVQLDINSNDEISELYDVIRSMQINIIDYLNDLYAMQQDNLKYATRLQKARIDIKNKDEQIGQISKDAYQDSLTGVGNITSYMKKVEKLNGLIKEETPTFAIVVADINDLKKINDQYGHKAGDTYIIGCCHTICEIYKHSPVFRIGGDEFVVILQGSDYNDRYGLLEKTKASFAKSSKNNDAAPCERYSTAVGMAEYASDDSTVELVFKRADKAMYTDKLRYKRKNGSYR